MKHFYKYGFTILILYLFQFIVAPIIFEKYFPITNEAFFILLISTGVILTFAFIKGCDKLLCWFLSDFVYFLFILLYSGNGAFGIGMSGITLDGMQANFVRSDAVVGAFGVTLLIIIEQLIIKCIFWFAKKLKTN